MRPSVNDRCSTIWSADHPAASRFGRTYFWQVSASGWAMARSEATFYPQPSPHSLSEHLHAHPTLSLKGRGYRRISGLETLPPGEGEGQRGGGGVGATERALHHAGFGTHRGRPQAAQGATRHLRGG